MAKKYRPIIGISGGMLTDEGGMFPGYRRAYVNNDYIKSVIRSGGIPVIIPITNNYDIIKEQVNLIDALILSGGQDLNPLIWGEEPSQKLGEISPERDDFDITLLNYTMNMKKPILGICRGLQLINVACGGTVHQDLSLVDGCYIKHNQGKYPSVPTHTVKIKEDTKLHDIFGGEILTNSFHHLAINKIAKNFNAVAYSEDGIIEGIEKTGDECVIAVQWHPEMMTGNHSNMQKLFDFFVNEVKSKSL